MWKKQQICQKSGKNIKIKRKPGNKPSQISKNRKKCQKKPVENRQKYRKIVKNVKKQEKTSQKYRKIIKNTEKL